MNDISSEKLLDDWILSGKNEIYSRLEKNMIPVCISRVNQY